MNSIIQYLNPLIAPYESHSPITGYITTIICTTNTGIADDYCSAYFSFKVEAIEEEILREEDVKPEVIDFLKKLADHLKDVPEEAILVCTEALKFAWEKIVAPNQMQG